ncbi:hypothetical protein DFR71_2784 [Nocardia alba]|uniref:Uncharacterized protein n=2 Tax=Nocardia alba TaxID=225051 RepID=A0A4R1FZI5_9NOCA|nr:hypothetical protein DFR71_2784 [Nocardia alba]
MHVFASSRTFEVWRWGPGHTGLLLRSWVDNEEPRIEVLFKPADFVCLPSRLTGVDIAMVTDGDVWTTAQRVVGRDLKQCENLFVVTSEEMSGWVVGGSANGRTGPESGSREPMFDGWEARDPIRDIFTTNTTPH